MKHIIRLIAVHIQLVPFFAVAFYLFFNGIVLFIIIQTGHSLGKMYQGNAFFCAKGVNLTACRVFFSGVGYNAYGLFDKFLRLRLDPIRHIAHCQIIFPQVFFPQFIRYIADSACNHNFFHLTHGLTSFVPIRAMPRISRCFLCMERQNMLKIYILL